jgi:hypothetical protein
LGLVVVLLLLSKVLRGSLEIVCLGEALLVLLLSLAGSGRSRLWSQKLIATVASDISLNHHILVHLRTVILMC